MKKQPPSIFSKDIWREVEMVFWRQELSCMPKEAATDGLDLCLARPRFSSIESVTVEKLRVSTITESDFEDGFLSITIA